MRRPRIGIDLDHEHDGRRWVFKLPTTYFDAVWRAGGLPVPIPPGDARDPHEILEGLDGLLMTGGDDIHPAAVGAEVDGMPMRLLSTRRERFVLDLAAAALDADFPTLGVCLGSQALCVATGGSLCFDIYTDYEAPLEHRNGAEHLVLPEPGGTLDRLWGGENQLLISHHHQSAHQVGPSMEIEARAEDGVLEAFRARDKRFVFAVQWHPEQQYERKGGFPILRELIRAAGGTTPA